MITETNIYESLALHINTKYPGLRGLYHFDLSGINNSSLVSRSLYSRLNGRGFPDFELSYGVYALGIYYRNLYMEIKVEGTKLKREKDLTRILKGDYKIRKAGDWWDLHIEEQANRLDLLRDAGNVAVFTVGLDETIQTFDSYVLGAGLNKPETDLFQKALGFVPQQRLNNVILLDVNDDGEKF